MTRVPPQRPLPAPTKTTAGAEAPKPSAGRAGAAAQAPAPQPLIPPGPGLLPKPPLPKSHPQTALEEPANEGEATAETAEGRTPVSEGAPSEQAASAHLGRTARQTGQQSLGYGTGQSAESTYNFAPVAQLQNKLSGSLAHADPLPDAFTLLKDAREEGQLFTEDWKREGHTEEKDDPALAAAVEECIRLCFGLPGIQRIGPGRDDQHLPIIVVVAARGFTEATLAKVPPRVFDFNTTIALPFELLPLRRDVSPT